MMTSKQPADQCLIEAVTAAAMHPLLLAFGAAAPDLVSQVAPKSPHLLALHVSAAYLKIAIVCDVMRSYTGPGGRSIENYRPLKDVLASLGGVDPTREAATIYSFAIDHSPGLAEAHYGLGRCAQRTSDVDKALQCFERVLQLEPHAGTPAHAHLLANAHWERAGLLEGAGRLEEALSSYRAALARLDMFGVHHIKVARLMRRVGLFEEAAIHFRRCMTYSHRYFPEFILPALGPSTPPVDPITHVIYETRRRNKVIFWRGSYLSIPAHLWPGADEFVKALAPGGALAKVVQRASSIAALEPD